MSKSIVNEALRHFVTDLHSTHGDNLVSVVLYGSAAAGDHTKDRSDYNLLIALDHITPEDLRLSQAPVREWQRLGHPLPVYFTVEELSDAGDVFPIEFLQMEKARVVLYGKDPFESVEVTKRDLRHQTEYELRSKLILLRRHYISASGSSQKLSELMRTSLTTFATFFRPVIALNGQEPPVTKIDTVRSIVRLLGLDSKTFERILSLPPGDETAVSEVEADELFAAYMAQIEHVIEFVDRLEVEE
jgi:predicted nucleotidyltransferase